MKKSELTIIVDRLKELQKELLIAKTTIDKRSQNKQVNDARKNISVYAYYLPNEVKAYLFEEVDLNAMSYQYAEGDIKRCIIALEEWMQSLPEDSD